MRIANASMPAKVDAVASTSNDGVTSASVPDVHGHRTLVTVRQRHDQRKVNLRSDDQVDVIREGEERNVRDDLLYFLIRAPGGPHLLEGFRRHRPALPHDRRGKLEDRVDFRIAR